MPSTKPMNVLLITADQLRADALNCYGNPVCRTPHIDRLANQGVVFDHAYTPNPICVPARATITTGNYSHRCTTSKNNGGRIRDDQVKLAEHFKAHGYRTYACGKLHYSPYAPPDQPRLVHGFETWDSAESGRILNKYDPKDEMGGLEDYADYLKEVGWGGYSRAHGIGNNDVRPCASPLPEEHCVDAWVASRTIERITQHQTQHADQPFLIWCSFPKPHAPLDPPFDYAQMYNPREVPDPFGSECDLDNREPNLLRTHTTHALASLSPEARKVAKVYYYGLISFQDAQIGRVLDKLEELGQLDNTIILYCADHGDLMGDFGMFFKTSFLRGSIEVPFIVRCPGKPENEHRSQMVGLQDILPTLASMAGCPLPQPVDGIDLTEAIENAEAPGRDIYYAQCFDTPRQMAMVTDGTWKYSYAQEGPTQELYNLQDDPNELVNLATDPAYADTAKQWHQTLIKQAKHFGDTALLDDTTETGMCITPVDRDAIRELPISGMGWRWY